MGRDEERNRTMREDRRRRILAEAVRLFATRGLEATRVGDIAAAAEMSPGLLYHYFASKEEIFEEILRWAFSRMNAAARELEGLPLSPREKLKTLVRQVLQSVGESEEFVWYSSLISLASLSDTTPPGAREILRREREVPYRVVASIVRAGQEEGSVPPGGPDDLAALFWAAVKGLALHRAAWGEAFRLPDPELLARIFFPEGGKPA
jgi:AcrR family transcriptional regulator